MDHHHVFDPVRSQLAMLLFSRFSHQLDLMAVGAPLERRGHEKIHQKSGAPHPGRDYLLVPDDAYLLWDGPHRTFHRASILVRYVR
jgi:hypothetical protein